MADPACPAPEQGRHAAQRPAPAPSGLAVGDEPQVAPHPRDHRPTSPPPRRTYALFGTRVRMSLGMVVCFVAAAMVPALAPGEGMSWVPLALVVGTALSTLVHEGAHAWAAHRLGYRVDWIVLGGLVGVTAYEGPDGRPLDRAAVALAGPAASAALVLALLALHVVTPAGHDVTIAVETAIALNALALVANLLPVGGTDGAQCGRALVQHWRSTRSPAAVRSPEA